MMQLGLTGSMKTDNTGIAQSKENYAKLSSRNGGKENDFAKALGAGQSNGEHGTGKAEGQFDEQGIMLDGHKIKGISKNLNGEHEIDLAKWNVSAIGSDNVDGNSKEFTEIETGGLVRLKNLESANAEQIAFVTIDSALAEKLAPVKANASTVKGIDGLDIAVDVESSTVTKNAEKVETKDLTTLENKKQKPLKNKMQISDGAELKNTSPETKGNIKFVNANEVTSAKDKNFAKATELSVKPDISAKSETSAKSENSKAGTEVATERGLSKFKSLTQSNSQFTAAQVKIKTSNSTVNFLPETKIENLATALQQIVTTPETKSGAQVETVSAPRLVLPESQSVVPQKTIEIQLLPKTLGLIQVKIEITDGKMTLMIETQSAKAEAAIKLETVQIMETIKAAGLSVEEISVRRNAELSQQDQAINDYSSDQNAQEQMANGEFGEHFDEENKAKKEKDLDGLKTNEGYNGGSLDTRTGIYL